MYVKTQTEEKREQAYAAPGLWEERLGVGEAAGEVLLEEMTMLEIPVCAQMLKDVPQALIEPSLHKPQVNQLVF